MHSLDIEVMIESFKTGDIWYVQSREELKKERLRRLLNSIGW